MPFLRAGFNPRHRDTGIRAWTRPARGYRQHEPAELVVFTSKPPFVHDGDFAWLHYAKRPKFLAWGEQCAFGSWPIELAFEHSNEYGLAHCDIETRREWPSRWA